MPRAVLVVLSFLLAAGAATLTATYAVQAIEMRATRDVRLALSLAGHDWAHVEADGLQLALSGTAPDEATRFRALSIAGGSVDPARVIDRMEVASAEPPPPPPLSIEILRSGDAVSLIGMVPEETDRQAILDRIARSAFETPITDLLQSAAVPAPETWDEAVDFGLDALKVLPSAKVSITPDRVAVATVARSRSDKARIEDELGKEAPDGVEVALSITAPRPVITPFVLRFAAGPDGPRFEACAAGTEEGRRAILKAGRAAGVSGDADCPVGIGAPAAWQQAVSAGISAVTELGAGSITFSDSDVTLTAARPEDGARLDEAAGSLEAALPEGFSLNTVLPEPKQPQDTEPPAVTALRDPDGSVRLRGRIGTGTDAGAVDSFARAAFGREQVSNGLREASPLPAGWTPRVLAALDGLSLLHHGSVSVGPDLVTLSGVSGAEDAAPVIARILAEQLGEGAEYRIDVRYDETLDPAYGMPTPEECVARINEALKTRQITFSPGSDVIDPESRETVDAIAGLMENCTEVSMEIGGYTDSQGREEMNQELSQSRAEAVLDALAERRVPIGNLHARGYGEENPIADNDTPEGREANRRIAVTLLDQARTDEQASADDGADAATEAGDDGAGSLAPETVEAEPGDAAPSAGADAEDTER